jgi:hypothetical protein
MTTAIRPKSKKEWEEEVPDCVNSKGEFTPEFNSNLYLIAAGARMGWENMPKRGLSITEQAYVAWLRSTVQTLNTAFSFMGGFYEQHGMLSGEIQSLTPGQINVLVSLGRTMLAYAYIAKANPEVGHFIGSGNEQNQKDADKFLNPDA